jgi:hypothetical protein
MVDGAPHRGLNEPAFRFPRCPKQNKRQVVWPKDPLLILEAYHFSIEKLTLWEGIA